MGLSSFVKSLYQRNIGSDLVRTTVQPVGALTLAASDAAAGAWVWSAYVQIVAAAVIPNPCWLLGIHMDTPTVEAIQADLAIATGAGAAEVDIAMFCIAEELFAVVEGKSVDIMLPVPIRIAGTPRLAVRVRKNTGASAAGVSIKVYIGEAIGT